MELSYLTYGSQTADAFVIRVSDAESFDELKIIPIAVSSHSRLQVGFPSDHDSVESGTLYSNYFSLVGVSDYTVVDASLSVGPFVVAGQQAFSKSFPFAWMRPSGLSGDFEIEVVFPETRDRVGQGKSCVESLLLLFPAFP